MKNQSSRSTKYVRDGGYRQIEGPTRREPHLSEVAHRAKERAKRRKARKVAKVHQHRNRR